MMEQRRLEQAKLARALIDGLGFNGAVSACSANGWDGVLLHVLSLEHDPGREPAGRVRP